MFTLVILNSTVKINADFQLITALAKIIESVDQMNSSISKINDRLEKLESTIPIKTEPIVPDTEPKHGLIDNMIKTLESEKMFIRKSVSAHEKKFQAFESQMKRHLSTIHTAIGSNKDNIEKQTQLINDTIDKLSDTFEKELILINVNIDEKADALEQQMVLVNATIDSNNEMVEQQIQLINVTIDKKCETLEKELILINVNIDEKADALEKQMVLVNATIDSNNEMVETQIQLINVTIDKHCETLEKELRLINTTLERQYRTQRCSYSHGSLQLYNGNTELNIAEHDSTVEVKCKKGDNYELKNTETGQYINSYDTKCLFGHLDKDLSMLKCLPTIMCPPLPDISRGKLFQDSSDGLRDNYQSVAEYSCERGYRIFGKHLIYKRTCQLNGEWSGESAKCEAPICEEIEIVNGIVIYVNERRTENSYASISCHEGFKLFKENDDNPKSLVKCQVESGRNMWLPEPPICDQPCDTNTLSGIDVYRDGTVITGQVRSNVTYSLKCRPPKPRWWERIVAYVFDVGPGEKPEQVKRRCENGNFVNVPGCIAKPCESNNKFIDLYQYRPSDVQSEVSHGAQVSAKCKEVEYEMKNTNSGQYLSTFSTKCQYGVFDKDLAYRSLICLPKRCSYSDRSLQLYSGKTPLNTVEHDTTVEVTCKNDDYELMNTKTSKFINNFRTKCQFGHLDEDLSVLKCFPKRCHNDNSDIVIYTDGRSTIVVPHDSTAGIKCKDDRHELQNTATGNYESNLDIACSYGKFSYQIHHLTCLPKRCHNDNSDIVLYRDGSSTNVVRHNSKAEVKCSSDKYELVDSKTGMYPANLITACQYGEFDPSVSALTCKEKRCYYDYASNGLYHSTSVSGYIKHGDDVAVKCENYRFGLRNTKTGEYINNFSTECQYGVFNTHTEIGLLECVPKPCNTTTLRNTLVYKKGTKLQFKQSLIPGNTTYELQCEPRYMFEDAPDGDKIESACQNGNFQGVLKCVAQPCVLSLGDANLHLSSDSFNGSIVDGSELPHNTKVVAKCKNGFELSNNGKFTNSKTMGIMCSFGTIEIPSCVEKRCKIRKSEGDCYLRHNNNSNNCLSKNLFNVRSDRDIKLRCNSSNGYAIRTANKPDRNEVVLSCKQGRLSENVHCTLKPCQIPHFKNATTNITAPEVSSGKKITYTCDQGYHVDSPDMTSQQTTMIKECRNGLVSPDLPRGCTPDGCDTSRVVNGHYIDGDVTVTEVVPHGRSLQLKCSDGYDIVDSNNDIVDNDEITVKCNKGVLKNEYTCKRCKNSRLNPKDRHNITENTTGINTTNGNSQHAWNMTCDEYPPVECAIEESDANKLYQFKDQEGNELLPPFNISSGVTVTVDCVYDDYYTYSYEYGFNATCMNGALNIALECAGPPEEPQIECSLDLQHGTVIYHNGDYIPQCDIGYKLNHTDPDKPCNCVNNKIECYAKASPECIANNCILPNVFNGFSVYEKKENDLFLSGGMEIKHGSSAYFNCSRGMDKHNEPFDRQFICELGKFKPVDGLKFDYSNDSTPVPLCRKAMCTQNCDNGGVCIRDDECRCPASTTGQWCETVLCDPSCERNGGTCVKPGQCGKCPAGRSGENCEQKVTCTLTNDLTYIESTRRIKFDGGETISAYMVKCRHGTPSPGTMTCRADGSWDGEITCIRNEIEYSVRLQVSASTLANNWSAGTDDNVFLRIVGQNGQTDKFQLKGDFGGNKLVQMDYTGTDVRPIRNVIVSKKGGLLIDNNLSLVYVSIYIEDSEEYYVFTGKSLHTWLTASQPLTLTISDHPENCASHTYGGAFYRHPKQRGGSVGFLTLLECKKRCVTSRSLKCKTVFYTPDSRTPGQGHCYHYIHSPDDDSYFRDSYRSETNNGYVSYKRICKTT